MYKLLRKTQFRGTCPGGKYFDEFRKEQPCPKAGKPFIFQQNSPFVKKYLKNIESGNVPIIEHNCPRCGSSFKLYPEPSPDNPIIYDETTLNVVS